MRHRLPRRSEFPPPAPWPLYVGLGAFGLGATLIGVLLLGAWRIAQWLWGWLC